MKTASVKASDITKQWVVVDAAGKTMGRLASQIAYVLRGKHKPSFVPHLDCGDNVIVTNAKDINLTGRKWEQKSYYSYSGYIGGIKEASAALVREKKPERLIEAAVQGMLPKNKLGRQIMYNLKIYADDKHPHDAQKPSPMKPRTFEGE
ncbi:MAG: 50S ribosomal protein L13 [Deltaproteobacteria bacterium]|nr:50S ribosomal protein L13 [Deltaproteobacteria bacterium]